MKRTLITATALALIFAAPQAMAQGPGGHGDNAKKQMQQNKENVQDRAKDRFDPKKAQERREEAEENMEQRREQAQERMEEHREETQQKKEQHREEKSEELQEKHKKESKGKPWWKVWGD